MSEPTSVAPDLDEFCLLDRLGLALTGQRTYEHTVLSCRGSRRCDRVRVRGYISTVGSHPGDIITALLGALIGNTWAPLDRVKNVGQFPGLFTMHR